MISIVAVLKPKIQVVAVLQPRKINITAVLKTILLGGGSLTENLEVEFVAQEDIPQYSVVTIDGFVGDSDNLVHKNKILGIANDLTPQGQTGIATVEGEIENLLWTWNVNDNLYLNGINLSSIPPAGSARFSKIIGRALTATKILIELEESIQL